ncbi:MAG TPA: DUF3995 domain-containing protein [Devosia sp.]|nr:DUF3995 domain-containing protein [Devosia sp.]
MNIIAIFIAAILFITALIHVGWGFGMLWPATDEQTLIKTVIGSPNITTMPSLGLTLFVAAGIAGAGLCALWGARVINLPLPEWMRLTSLVVLAVIFTVRGIMTYLPIGPLSTSLEPFRTLDQTYFAPLILVIAAGYISILVSK